MDTAGYLFLGVSYGVVAWVMARIYIIRKWALFAWMGFGFAALAVPCSLAALFQENPNLQTGHLSVYPPTRVVPWPIIWPAHARSRKRLKPMSHIVADVRQIQRSKLRFGYDRAFNVSSEAPG
jgi:hypothetical protein